MDKVVRIHPEDQDNKDVTALVLKGKVNIDGIEFHHIEGGFGGDKRVMLVKDIANIHGKEIKHINEAINSNRKRFKNGIDILDIKGSEFVVDLVDHGIYSQPALNRSKNIYLLSDRGYAKLLKILEDDTAWELYDMLVDGYFNMKQIIREQRDPMMDLIAKDPVMAIRFDQLQMKDKLNAIEERVKDLEVQPRLSGTARLSVPEIQPVPTTDDCRWYTCKEIAEQAKPIKVTYHMVGKLATKHDLRTEEYSKIAEFNIRGQMIINKVVFNEAAKDKLLSIIKETKKTKRRSCRRRR